MLWLVLLKINAARIAFANRRAYKPHHTVSVLLSSRSIRGARRIHTWFDISSWSSRGKLTK